MSIAAFLPDTVAPAILRSAPEFPERIMQQPKHGQVVWVFYFNAQNRDAGVTARVVPLTFDKVVSNYLGKLGPRWVLVTPGKPLGGNYGVAHKPERVYQDEPEAALALKRAVIVKINQLENALSEALKGNGGIS
jgi:hypothetical protein